jgi:hypothetical protein
MSDEMTSEKVRPLDSFSSRVLGSARIEGNSIVITFGETFPPDLRERALDFLRRGVEAQRREVLQVPEHLRSEAANDAVSALAMALRSHQRPD